MLQKKFCIFIFFSLVFSFSVYSSQYSRGVCLYSDGDQKGDTARQCVLPHFVLLKSARKFLTNRALSVKALPGIASDCAVAGAYRLAAINASERRRFVLQGAVLMSPMSLSKKEEFYKDLFPKIHTHAASPLPVIMYPIYQEFIDETMHETFLDPATKLFVDLDTKLFVERMIINDAVFKGSLIFGRKNYINKGDGLACGGYVGLPIELVEAILQYSGTAP